MSGQRSVLITGGAGGIGAAIAQRMAAGGDRVVIADVDIEAGEVIAAKIGGHFIRTDVAELADNCAAVAQIIERFGSLDVAILNAGVGEVGGYPGRLEVDAYRHLAAVNQDGVVYGMYAALEPMLAQGSGAIIVTAALAALGPSPVMPLYAATKYAAIGLVRSTAPAVADQGVLINALCPTFIDTPMVAGIVPHLEQAGIAILPPEAAADAVQTVLADGRTGQVWPLVPNQDLAPMTFAEPPTITADPAQALPEPPQ